MKTILTRTFLPMFLLSVLVLLAAPCILAQQARVNLEHNPQKNTENIVPFGANVISPEVNDDKTVTFRVNAPEANDIRLARGPLVTVLKSSEPIPFKKDDEGLWTLTVGPVPPNMYVYRLMIDGVTVTDPIIRLPALPISRRTAY